MLNANLGFDDETYSTVLVNNSSQKPQFNHSVVTNKTRDSVILLNLDEKKKPNNVQATKDLEMNNPVNPAIKRGLSDLSSVVSKKSESKRGEPSRQ